MHAAKVVAAKVVAADTEVKMTHIQHCQDQGGLLCLFHTCLIHHIFSY